MQHRELSLSIEPARAVLTGIPVGRTDAHAHHRVRWLLPLLLVAGAAQALAWLLWPEASPLAGRLGGGLLATAAWSALAAWAAAGLAMLAWRVVRVARYRPVPGCADDALPEITVIVPAYNEGAQVLGTLRSVLASDYPADRLRVIAVDDGSTDDTWWWIRRARAEAPTRIEAIHYERNRGKRYALARGFLRSRGLAVVTIDSDSEIEPDTLRNLVSPMVVDPRVGAVAGNVRILNREAGVVPRMLDVAFTYSFDFVRASQSEIDLVLCTPGALSAYRRNLVMDALPAWLGQRFLGRPAAIGEDRAMTNAILRAGHHVTFQANAVVHTQVPTRWRPLSKMLLRWARSNLRETWVTLGFVLRRFRDTPRLGARLEVGYHVIALLAGIAVWLPSLLLVAVAPVVGLPLLALGTLLGSVPPAMVYGLLRRGRGALWALAYGFYSLVVLSWISPYALVSLRNSGWLTRGSGSS